MTFIQYSLDDPWYPLMNGVKEVQDLTNTIAREHWIPVDRRVRQKYGLSLAEFIFYGHWLQEKAVAELAAEIGEGRQVLKNLTGMLHLPVKDKKESFTPHVRQRISAGQENRSPETRRKNAESNTIFQRPPRKVLYTQYWIHGMSGSEIGNYFGVSSDTVYLWMEKEKIPRRSISEALKGKPSWKKGKSYEECYGERKAAAVKKNMRGAWKRRKDGN